MKVRRIDRLVSGCQNCPYCHEVEDMQTHTYRSCCVAQDEDGHPDEPFLLNLATEVIHENCPLPEEEIREVAITQGKDLLQALGLDPHTTAGVACCPDVDIDFNQQNTQQFPTIQGIPDEWLDKLVLSDSEKAKLQEDEDARINELLEDMYLPETFPPHPEK